MTVSSTSRRAGPFTGNGVTTSFPFTFKVFAASDLQITHTNAAGVATVLRSNFSVALNANQDTNPGGTITYPTTGAPMANTESLVAIGALGNSQPTDITNAGRFLPQAIEDGLDRATILVQQLAETLSRTLRFPVSDAAPVVNAMPSRASRLGKFFGWDAGGDPVALSGTGNDAALRTDLASGVAGALLVAFKSSGVGAVIRTLWAVIMDLPVSVRNFGAAGDGSDDTAAIAAAIATGKNVYVPKGASFYATTSELALLSGQTLELEEGAEIRGNFNGFVFKTIGTVSAPISSVTAAIAALTWTVTMADASTLAAGDVIVLHDIVTDDYEVNEVSYIVGNVLYTMWPIAQPFATAANVNVLKMKPVTRAKIHGGTVRNVHASGGGTYWLYTRDCEVSGVNVEQCPYIGNNSVISIGTKFDRNVINRSGKSGIGLRVTKACSLTNNTIFDNRSDEPITLYKGNSHAVITGNTLNQEMHNGAGVGGNAILLHDHNFYNTIVGNACNGSPTYLIYLLNNCSYNTIVGNTLARALQGSVRVELNSNGNIIDANACTNIITGGTAAIEVTSGCSGNVLGVSNTFASLGGVAVRNGQAGPGAQSAPKLDSLSVVTDDFASTVAGSHVKLSMGASTGDTFAQLNASKNGDRSFTHLALQRYGGTAAVARAAPLSQGTFEVDGNIAFNPTNLAPTLGVNGDVSFQAVSNTQLKVLMRGLDGVTRSVTLTLA